MCQLFELRAVDPMQVELWMTRRCQGDEPGLCCCLSLRPSRCLAQPFGAVLILHVGQAGAFERGGLSDSTLDPGKALASGHFFADRGAFDGSSSA